MKRALCISVLLLAVSGSVAQTALPPEWAEYTFGEYLCDIQSGCNTGNMSETEFKNYLLDIARANLAKQISVRVDDVARMDRKAADGRTSMTYASVTSFATDVDLKLVETRTMYDHNSGEGFAIAYIDKSSARNYYRNELSLVCNELHQSVILAENLVAAGFKAKARTVLDSASARIVRSEEPLLWLNITGTAADEIENWQERLNAEEQAIERMLSELQYGTVICIFCTADLFGCPYPTLQNELKGILAADGCSFTDDASNADWVISVVCEAREYNSREFGGVTSFFAFVDAHIAIDKVLTSQRIAEDEFEVKGGHTIGYKEAARAAYKDAKQRIGEIITKNLKQ